MEEVLDQHRDVLGALAERRQVQRDDVQPVIEVAAEMADADLLVEIAVGRGDDARVDRNGFRRADGDDFAVLQRPQELDLRRRRRLADFVEEERALRRRAEQADLVANGAGERSLHVTEQFALEQAFGERAAVDREEGPFRAHGEIVDVARDDFLAGSRLALNEHGRIGRRDGLDEVQHVEPRLADADGTRIAVPLGAADRLLERLVLDAKLAVLGGAPQDRHQLVVAERLLDVVESALVHGLHGGLQGGLRRHEDDRHVRIRLARGRQDLDAADVGHPDVGQHDVRPELADAVEARLAAVRHVRGESLVAQQDVEGVENARLVVDDEDRGPLGVSITKHSLC